MTTVPDTRLHTDAVVAAVDGLVTIPVGRAAAPSSPPPYIIVWPGAALLSGPLNDPHSDGQITYRITSVGANPSQAEWWAQTIRDGLLLPNGGPFGVQVAATTGYLVAHMTVDNLGAVTRDEDVSPIRWYVVDVYRAYVTPAAS